MRFLHEILLLLPLRGGMFDPAHIEIYEKLEADIAHRRAVAGLQET
jgi:hypothetical protein